MSKPLLEILNGSLDVTMELNRESRKYIHVYTLMINRTYKDNEEIDKIEKFDVTRCTLDFLSASLYDDEEISEFGKHYYDKKIVNEGRHTYCI